MPIILFSLACPLASAFSTAQPAPSSILPSPGASPSASPTPDAPTRQQQPTFGAVVSRVRVDVIVTDADGRFVEDLRPEDFRVYEDGEIQQVLTVQIVDSGAGTVIDMPSAPATGAPLETIQPDDTEAPMEDTRAGDLGAMVFLIDGYSLDPVARARFASGWNEILEATESFDVPRAAYVVDAAGSLEELAPLTYEVDTLRQVAEEVRDLPTFGISMESRLIELLADMQSASRAGTRSPVGTPSAAGVKARGYEHDELLRSISTLETLTTFCNALAARSGRTALVWVSAGVKLTEGGPYGALVGTDPFELLGNMSPDNRIIEREAALHEAANSANVSIYAIDPTTPGARRNIGLTATASAATMEALQRDEVRWAISALSDSLYNAADATGGQAFIMPSDLALVLRAVTNDGRQYYMLTYAAPPPYGDSEYHEIHVEVQRPDVSVRARGGYVDLPEDERKDRMIFAALTLPGMVTRMPVEAEAIRRWSQDGEPIVQMLVAVEDDMGAGAPRMEVHAFAVDGKGDIFAEVHEDVRPLDEPEAGRNSTAPFIYVHDWSLAPGEYELRVAVQNSASGELGAARIEVEVPDLSTSTTWAASDLMLTIAAADGSPRPVVGGRFGDGDTVSVYAEVAGGIAPFISGMIIDAEVADSRPALLPASHLQRDMAGLHRGSIGFRGLPAGDYWLEIAVTDAHADRQTHHRRHLTVISEADAAVDSAAPEAGPPHAGATGAPDLDDPAALPQLLERLARVAWLYQDQALSFVADELVRVETHDVRRFPPSRERTFEFEYIYGRMDDEDAARLADTIPGKFADYRRRKGSRRDEMAPDEVVRDLRLPALISKAYSFPLIFREILWPAHEFALLGKDEILGRPAVAVGITPKPPIQHGMNDWFGTAWFDQESLQPLKFVIFQEVDYRAYKSFEAAMRGETSEDEFTFTRVTAVFEIEKNGMRFPSEIVQERSRFRVKGEPSEREASDYPEFRVAQSYSNYRFFNVRTEEEIREAIFGRSPRGGTR